ncbi:MAG: CHAT domain-containing protein [Gammaproteobacteria bacterium]|nr:CHAT domain-containing protein [Gammaproteobacteria bacterium]
MFIPYRLAAILIITMIVAGCSFGPNAQWRKASLAGKQANEEGNYTIAIKHYETALKIARTSGKQDLVLAVSLNTLAMPYISKGRYKEAEFLLKQSLVIFKKIQQPEYPIVIISINNLATIYKYQGQYEKAESQFKHVVQVLSKELNEADPDLINANNNLATVYQDQGKYEAAETLFKQTLASTELSQDIDDRYIVRSLSNLATLYLERGLYIKAAPLLKQALVINEKSLGKSHPDVARVLNNLSVLHQGQGHYTIAEPLLKRALVIFEKSLGKDHPQIAITLANLAFLYSNQGRHPEVEPLLIRALSILEKKFGLSHPSVAITVNNLALHHLKLKHYKQAELLLKRSKKIYEKFFSQSSWQIASILNNLGGLYYSQARFDLAESFYKQAIITSKKVYADNNPNVARNIKNLALLYQDQGRFDIAESLHMQALSIRKKTLDPFHPSIAGSNNLIALLFIAQNNYSKALQYSRQATNIHRQRILRSQSARSDSHLQERQSVRFAFLNNIGILSRAIQAELYDSIALTKESLELSQLARSSGAAHALTQLSARFATGKDALAKRVREHQDILSSWKKTSTSLTKAFSKPPEQRQPEKEIRLRKQLVALDQRLLDLGAALTRDFPEYVALTNPAPVSLKEIQRLLKADEAILSYLTGKAESYLLAIRKNKIELHRIDLNKTDLDNIVKELRLGLDSENTLNASKKQPDSKQKYHALQDYLIPAFDLELANELYQKLLSPAEALLKGAQHVMIIPDGALTSLPFSVLVTQKPASPVQEFRQYRNIAWLNKKYALSTLPSLGALRILRHFAKQSKASHSFIGFGDPLVGDDKKTNKETRRGLSTRALFNQGPIADAATVRSSFARLKETKQELEAMASALGANRSSIYVQDRATETRVRNIKLTPHRVIAFATHALTAGEFKGVAEPALVLTPPKISSETDDGLLTASEIAKLKLDADWVILSACNTAAADGTPGAEGLSGLARSFFYAGSRTLVVSHWYVVSDSTKKLLTGMFREIARNPGMRRAKVMQLARMKLIKQRRYPYYAHPMFWAPFVIVGEGSG